MPLWAAARCNRVRELSVCPPDQQGLADELLLEMGEYSSMPCSADTGIYAAAAPAQPAAAPVGK